MSDYDVTCRFLIRTYGAEFIRWLLRLAEPQVKFVNWIDTNMTEAGRTERVSDTIAWLLDLTKDGEPWAVVVEFQTDPDPDMFGRLLEYLGSTYRLFRPSEEKGDRFQVGAVVVNLRGKGRSFRRAVWKFAGLAVILRGREWNLGALDARKVIREIEQGITPRPVLAFVPLMKRGGEPDTIQRWLKAASAEADPKLRANLKLAYVFASDTDHGAEWKAALEGWDVNESRAVREWKAEARAEARADLFLKQLEIRFGKLPKALRSAVQSAEDDSRFLEWFRVMLKAESLDQFREQAGI